MAWRFQESARPKSRSAWKRSLQKLSATKTRTKSVHKRNVRKKKRKDSARKKRARMKISRSPASFVFASLFRRDANAFAIGMRWFLIFVHEPVLNPAIERKI